MTTRDFTFSKKLFQSSAPFSHFVRSGDLGFVSGIIAQDPRMGGLVSEDVSAQCRAMIGNLSTLLNEVGLGLENVLRTTVYLLDYADFHDINAVYAEEFTAPFPARTTLQVAGLPLGARVQIDAVVSVPSAA
ncbi:RidA family protein [Arthrobacter sp. CJ23]|uniref:RidA family protein n=1 Tax=Arthrobacter sp. CJ23 TaxID=2972479 RepID=UPI00215D1A91|nr:Rid family hydrolase [Arthrobacter sp. CJ23]UVJ40263.1 Rid family hydrolase [Arthrobacter sp. CJ23]